MASGLGDLTTGYLDPNTGGMLFQILAALFVALSGFVLVFSSRIKMGWARLKRFLRDRASGNRPE